MRKLVVALASAVAALLAFAAVAPAAKQATVTASKSVAKGCQTKFIGGTRHSDVVRATSTARGLVRARLSSRGDWDVAVFDAKTKRRVAGSAAFRGNELAEGFVRKGQRLLVQACRFSGRASHARVSVSFLAASGSHQVGKTQVVSVSTPTRADKRRLQTLGLDLTESGDANSIDVVLYGQQDVRKLQRAKFRYTVRVADLAKRVRAQRRADRRYSAAQAGGSALPSGSTGYRHLADIELELKQLAGQYPKLVRPFTLNHKTHEGRDVVGIEIATHPYNLNDGKPIFANIGTHHAREWPAAEHPLEWAYDLLTNYGKQARTTRLVRATRNIVIPVVNPDGFNISREAPDFPPETEFGQFSYEMKRKNCWPNPDATGPCDNSSVGRLLGVDPNRNYGAFWGGSGASVDPLDDTFRGTGPFSEPETQNIRELQSTRTITNLITNHTFSNLILRPPGVVDVGPPLEEPLLKDLGARMAGHNGYSNIPGYGLYDTTGSTEDWTFWVAGSLGYTFEIGDVDFHPPYEQGVVAEYLGLAPAAGAGLGGNREAYYEMLESTANARDHSVISGRAPKGWTLKIHKSFMTSTSPVWQDDFGIEVGPAQLFPDVLDYKYKSKGGRFDWNVNPSTRPVVAGRDGRDPVAPKQADITFANPPGQPAENQEGDYATGAFESIPFTVGGPPEVDNGRMTVHIEWGNPDTDWDLYIVNEAGEVVTQSASFGDTTEDAVLVDPPPGNYTAHVVNFDQLDGQPFDDWTSGHVTFLSPTPRHEDAKEAWQLSCLDKKGKVRATRQVVVDRGDRVNVGKVCGANSIAAAKKAG
jgi:Zinc carboxypeptidase